MQPTKSNCAQPLLVPGEQEIQMRMNVEDYGSRR